MSIQDYIQTLQVRIDTLKAGDTFCIDFDGAEYTLTADPFPNNHYIDKTGLVIKTRLNGRGEFELFTLPYGFVVYKTS
jgi:hypothetical protein